MRALVALVLAATFLPGCGFLFSTIVSATRGPPGPLTTSSHVSGRTIGGMSRRSISCGAASGSPQNEHAFIAPTSGTYTFDSTTSDYDGVLAVYDANGAELACNDDHSSTRSSEVAVALFAGQNVTVVQGGYAGGSGSYELWVTGTGVGDVTGQLTLADGTVVPVTPAAPPQNIALGTSVQGDTSGLGAIAGLACPPAGPMQEWTFTAAAEGSYLFQVDASYDAYLGVTDALGSQLGCNDDFNTITTSRVAVDLAAGSIVRVVVGGVSNQRGSYSLTAVQISSGGALTLAQPMLFTAGTSSSEPDLCGAEPGSIDRTFTFTPRTEAFYAFTSDVSGILVIGDGRRTAACLAISAEHRAGFVLKAGHRYSLALELGYPDTNAHTFQIDRMSPDAPDWHVPPQPVPITAFTTPVVDTVTLDVGVESTPP